MKTRGTKFEKFVDQCFPSELAYLREHNAFQDKEYFEILDKMELRLRSPDAQVSFSEHIDPRKYSRLAKAFVRKLKSIDVDDYYQWISRINHLIHIDSIPPSEQSKILREVQSYSPSWFHAGSFYRCVQAYEAYLLIRFRKKDLQIIQEFLVRYEKSYKKNEDTLKEVRNLTEKIVMANDAHKALAADELRRLYAIFADSGLEGECFLSKKTRYQAWLAYHLYHVGTANAIGMLGPMAHLEREIFSGGFYSRRILANFYANKLLVLSKLGRYQEAAYCGMLSIRHRTEDYLYYLNNYCSVLIHLGRNEEALNLMKSAFAIQKSTLDPDRRLVFVANYGRASIAMGNCKEGARMSRNFLEVLGEAIFKYRWQFFFKVYLLVLLRQGYPETVLRMERKYGLTERERRAGRSPQLALIVACARYQELDITEQEFEAQCEAVANHPDFGKHESILALLKTLTLR